MESLFKVLRVKNSNSVPSAIKKNTCSAKRKSYAQLQTCMAFIISLKAQTLQPLCLHFHSSKVYSPPDQDKLKNVNLKSGTEKYLTFILTQL